MRILLVLGVLLLAGCATADYSAWSGEPLDDLVVQAGPPYRSIDLTSGGRVLEYRPHPHCRVIVHAGADGRISKVSATDDFNACSAAFRVRPGS